MISVFYPSLGKINFDKPAYLLSYYDSNMKTIDDTLWGTTNKIELRLCVYGSTCQPPWHRPNLSPASH